MSTPSWRYNASLKLTWNQSFRGVRLSPRAAYMQILSETKKNQMSMKN